MQETQERMRRLETEQSIREAHIREHEESIDYSRHNGQNQSDESLRPHISPLKLTVHRQFPHSQTRLTSDAGLARLLGKRGPIITRVRLDQHR
jgi:hypothetical protein